VAGCTASSGTGVSPGLHRVPGAWGDARLGELLPTSRRSAVRIRRLLLDVDKAIQQPEIVDIAKAIDGAPGVAALNITVTEIDVQTVGMEVTVEGDDIDLEALVRAIESTGAVVHSIDELAAGDHVVNRTPRSR
jgi:uncharacterized protein